jgi:hypothetical protein
MLRIALALVFVIGCHNSPPSNSTPPAGSGSSEGSGTASGSGSGTTQGPPAGPGIGEKCGASDACAAGLECVHYFGIGGKAGGEFKTCEKKCDKDPSCPGTTKCATIADGPGTSSRYEP